MRVAFSVPEDDIVHVLSIDEFGVTSPNACKGESTVIEFVADQWGQFSYYCPLPSYRAQGMEGAFEVN